MDVFGKVAGVVVLIGGGSLLTLGLAFSGRIGLSWLALALTGALALATIVLFARSEQPSRQSSPSDAALDHHRKD